MVRNNNKNLKIGVLVDEPIVFETSLVQVEDFGQIMDLHLQHLD